MKHWGPLFFTELQRFRVSSWIGDIFPHEVVHVSGGDFYGEGPRSYISAQRGSLPGNSFSVVHQLS